MIFPPSKHAIHMAHFHKLKITRKQYERYVTEAYQMRVKYPYLRFAQCLWNIIYEDHPDLLDYITGTVNDCFYAHEQSDYRVVNFRNVIVKDND